VSHADTCGRTDMTKLIDAFRDYWNAPKRRSAADCTLFQLTIRNKKWNFENDNKHIAETSLFQRSWRQEVCWELLGDVAVLRLGLGRMRLREMSCGRISADKGWAKKPVQRAWVQVHVLGAVAKLRKATICFIVSVCPFASPRGLPQDGFLMKFGTYIFFETLSRKFQVLLKSDKNDGYFTWIPMHIYYKISLNSI
jgi:hypothetical protein